MNIVIPVGGGAPAPAPVLPKDVNFYDYDGKRVAAYTIAEAQALSALPTQPTHDGLTGQGWNFSLAQVNALTYPMNVGATYITDDGKTRLYIRIDKQLAVPLYWTQTVANGVTVNWGDGTAPQTFSGTGNKNTTHTYSSGGEYVITLYSASGCILGLGIGNDCVVIGGDGNYRYLLYKVEIGLRTTIGDLCFSNCLGLSSITISQDVTSLGANAFQSCYALTFLTIPSSISNVPNVLCSGNYSLSSISMPPTVTSIGSNSMQYCYICSTVTIPPSVTSVGASAFYGIWTISSITIPSGVTSIGNSAFNSCYFMKEVHCLGTTPPTLGGTSVFANVAYDCKIYVPSASLTAYQTATNWSTHASKMVGV